MICVTDITIVNTEYEDYYKIFRYDAPYLECFSTSHPDPELMQVKEEVIHGRKFVNNYGEEFCIGYSEDVGRAIGLPMEAFDNQRKDLEKSYRANGTLRKIVDEYAVAGFFKRLKYAFTKRI